MKRAQRRAGRLPRLRRTERGGEETLVPRWVPCLFAVLSLALVPAIARVFVSAPPLHLAMHWRLAWGGFDVALASLLAATGLTLVRGSTLAGALAAMTATLLCCDAWLDVQSSVGLGLTAAAIGEAAFAELPLAALLAWVALRFARVGAQARPSLRQAGFQIRHRRLVPPAGNAPAQLDEEPASQPRWRQWIPRCRAGQPGMLLPWWLPTVCLGLAIVLVPWTAWLFATLPQSQLAAHWHPARAGPDLALAIILVASAVALLRRWPTAEVLVAVAAALLLKDAWFNVLTARRGHSADALEIAIGLELPLAGICLWVAAVHARAAEVAWPYVRSLRQETARGDATAQPISMVTGLNTRQAPRPGDGRLPRRR